MNPALVRRLCPSGSDLVDQSRRTRPDAAEADRQFFHAELAVAIGVAPDIGRNSICAVLDLRCTASMPR